MVRMNFFFQNYLQNLQLKNITKTMRFVLLKPDFLSIFIDFGPIQLAFSPLLWTPYPGPPMGRTCPEKKS